MVSEVSDIAAPCRVAECVAMMGKERMFAVTGSADASKMASARVWPLLNATRFPAILGIFARRVKSCKPFLTGDFRRTVRKEEVRRRRVWSISNGGGLSFLPLAARLFWW